MYYYTIDHITTYIQLNFNVFCYLHNSKMLSSSVLLLLLEGQLVVIAAGEQKPFQTK